jgi:hypothetical protein
MKEIALVAPQFAKVSGNLELRRIRQVFREIL